MSRQNHAAQDRPFRVLPLALDWPRELLYARLETRVHRMMEAGLLREVGALLESGVPPAAQSMQGIGYKELIPVVMGQGDVDRPCGRSSCIRALRQAAGHMAARRTALHVAGRAGCGRAACAGRLACAGLSERYKGAGTMKQIIEAAEKRCQPIFARIDEIALENTARVLDAMQCHEVAARHFARPPRVYGYDDIGP